MTTQPITADAGIPDEAAPEARLMRHSYDGIREFDNPLPSWWSWIFIATIVFAIGYGVFYHVAHWGKTPDEKYFAALSIYDGQKQYREQEEASHVNEDVLARRAADPATLAAGRAIFTTRCVTCHNTDGQGLIGPNLTDLYSLHGDTRMHIYETVKRGAPGTAMLAWGEQMPPEDVVTVAAYAISLRGKNLAGKPHEGQPVQAFAP
jgi:cytochrome c oxidase cbb3-type subunit 3